MKRLGKYLTTLFFMLAAAAGLADEGRPQGETVIIADECGRGAAGRAAWVDAFARAAGGEVVNAARPGWKSSDVWYVREVLGQHPRAAAYVLMASPNDLKAIATVDPEAVARVGARYGYMADIIMEANPKARVLLAAPPQVDPARHAGFPESSLVLSEMLAANLNKTAQTRRLHFVNLLDAFPADAAAKSVFPAGAKEQERLGQMLAAELSDPVAGASAPLCAQVAKVAPPAAGLPVTDTAGADALASSIAADLAAMPGMSAGVSGRKTPAAPAVIRNYICDRDTSSVMSEEGVSLAQGVAESIRNALGRNADEEEEFRMNEAFNFPGADEYALVTREPPVNEAVISAIVPPAAASGFAGSVVDWDAVPAPENPGFNAVALAPANKEKVDAPAPRGVSAADFSADPDAVSVPGMSDLAAMEAAAGADADEGAPAGELLANVVREPVVIRHDPDAPQQDLSNAPWNRPVEVAAVTPENPEVAAAAPAEAAPETTAIAALPAAPARPAAPDDFGPMPDAEGGADEMPTVKMEALFNGEKTLGGTAAAGARRRYVNAESTMLPLGATAATAAAPLPAIPGYAVYIHTEAE